jgi:hypothetical protein
MATGKGANVLRAGADIARVFPSGSRRLMAILARRIRRLSSDVSAVIQARPTLALGLLSVLLGAALAAWKIKSFSRRQTLRHRLRHGRRQVKAALDLPPLVIKLLANPLVQVYLRRTVLRAVSRKRGR